LDQVENPEVEAEVGTEQEETPAEEPAEDVLSQLDLDDMSEADLRELSEKLGSRAVARFGELTAKRKKQPKNVSAYWKPSCNKHQIRSKHPKQ
jgi:hypothetical protein